MSDEVERTLCQLPSVFLFKIPPRRSAEGYRASEWPKDPMWTGKMKIIAKGREANILFIGDTNEIFASSPVTDGSVEKTVDSGRYFAIRIVNPQGRAAFIGLAFNERNDAFDFNVALQEHKSELEREDKAAQGILSETLSTPLRDLSLKEGEKIKINITGAKKTKKESTGGSGLLAPPPGSKPILAPPPASGSVISRPLAPAKAVASTQEDVFGSFSAATDPFNSSSDPFGDFTSSSSSGNSTSSASDPFGGFTGASDPFASNASSSSSSSSFASDPFSAMPVVRPLPHSSASVNPSKSADPFALLMTSSVVPANSSSNSAPKPVDNSGSVNLLDLEF